MQTLCGTPQYVAPEIINKSRGIEVGYSKAVDLWSMGVILYIILSGTPPFGDKDFSKILKADFKFPQANWSSISDEAKDLIRHLLCVSPETRLTVQQVLSHPWLADLSSSENTTPSPQSGVTTPPSTPPLSPKSPKQSKQKASPSNLEENTQPDDVDEEKGEKAETKENSEPKAKTKQKKKTKAKAKAKGKKSKPKSDTPPEPKPNKDTTPEEKPPRKRKSLQHQAKDIINENEVLFTPSGRFSRKTKTKALLQISSSPSKKQKTKN